MNVRRIAAAAGAGLVALLATAGTALADHTHVKVVGNGKCVLLAEHSGESAVELPSAVFERNPNVVIAPGPNNHPLHVLVHRGVPGSSGDYFVYGSPAGNAACSAGYVNRP